MNLEALRQLLLRRIHEGADNQTIIMEMHQILPCEQVDWLRDQVKRLDPGLAAGLICQGDPCDVARIKGLLEMFKTFESHSVKEVHPELG